MNDHYWRGIRDMTYITAALFLLAGLSQPPAEASAFVALLFIFGILAVLCRGALVSVWEDPPPKDRGR